MDANNHAGKASGKNVNIYPHQVSFCVKRHKIDDRGKYVRNI